MASALREFGCEHFSAVHMRGMFVLRACAFIVARVTSSDQQTSFCKSCRSSMLVFGRRALGNEHLTPEAACRQPQAEPISLMENRLESQPAKYERVSRGVLPLQRLNACEKPPTSR